MKRRDVLALGLAVLCAACKPESAQVGKDVGNAGADIAILKEASADVSAMTSAADSCDAARPLAKKAKASTDAAAGRIQTATGRATLDALRVQIRRVEEACPGN